VPLPRSTVHGTAGRARPALFGRWRRTDATSIDLRKAYQQLERLLHAIAVSIEKEDIPAARLDLGKAFEALHTAGPGEDGLRSDILTTPFPMPTV